METTSVFVKNAQAYLTDTLIVNQGSSRSGKTYAILQLLLVIAQASKKPLIISVVSRALPHLKLGAMRDFDKILLSEGIIPDLVKNKTDNAYKIRNSTIEFFGIDQMDKVHGPGRDILFVNEANFIKHSVFEHLIIRTSGTTFIDFNPSQTFWYNDEIKEKHAFIKSTYLDNHLLPEGIKRRLDTRLERYYKEKKEGRISKSFENWCKVYLFGELGVLEGAIFDNWEVGEFDQSLPFGFGLDYGFHPDPDALIKVAIDHKRKIIYLHECVYKTNNGTEDLINQISKHVTSKNLIVAESATPRTNEDIRRKGFNIVRVQKTKSVSDWLRVLQNYKLIITPESYNLEKELQNYLWSDKKAGIPIDDYNHLIDAFRYFAMNILQPRPKMRKIT